MVVEDSAVIRRLLCRIVAEDPRLELAAAVETAEEAIAQIPRLRPDVVSMDIRLPGMDGLEATRRIMAGCPVPIVVVADAVEDAALRISLNALRSGALAVVEKPNRILSGGYEAAARTIATQLAIMSEVPVIRRRAGLAGDPVPVPGDARPFGREFRPRVMAVAASTGGPPALARLLGALPADFPLPVLVVQHIGVAFVEGFASWLDGLVPMRVRVASDGERLVAGEVRVAPGGRHLGVRNDAGAIRVRLSDGAPVSAQRPSATVMFAELAGAGIDALGILLTGMGEDGAAGLAAMRRAGAYTITEHESTAVVYGMPAAAVRLGASCVQLPLDAIAGHVAAKIRGAAAP
ncbi:MAG: chemotaxis-specific protein-glutamate methyltransferase CheB [Gluconacetobacter diazotrophicus]|nr:chemotaxis-specific protein-glutamate methyltransferase CheB [Gluconacetobacter diazotrophicus]